MGLTGRVTLAVPEVQRHVCFLGDSGQELLAVSLSEFDPEADPRLTIGSEYADSSNPFGRATSEYAIAAKHRRFPDAVKLHPRSERLQGNSNESAN
jgi:hypothetical protein